MSPNNLTSEFRSRRRATSRVIRPWVFVAATAIAGLLVALEFGHLLEEVWRLYLIYGSFLVVVVAFIRINLAVSRLYRCPACDRVPIGSDGVILNPDACPRCGARLK